jgi:hypothetical protein
MISTIAFACISPDRVPVRWIEFTPELETSLGLSGLAGLADEPFNYAPIKESGPSGDGVQQHLYLVHTTASRIEFPALAFKGDKSLGGIFDMEIGFDCLGVCFYEFSWPGDGPGIVNDGDEPHDTPSPDDGRSDVAHNTVLDNKIAERKGRAMSGHATPRFVEQFHDFLRDSGTFSSDGILKVVSKYKVRAVLLVEPSPHGGKSRMRLYADTVSGDEI